MRGPAGLLQTPCVHWRRPREEPCRRLCPRPWPVTRGPLQTSRFLVSRLGSRPDTAAAHAASFPAPEGRPAERCQNPRAWADSCSTARLVLGIIPSCRSGRPEPSPLRPGAVGGRAEAFIPCGDPWRHAAMAAGCCTTAHSARHQAARRAQRGHAEPPGVHGAEAGKASRLRGRVAAAGPGIAPGSRSAWVRACVTCNL